MTLYSLSVARCTSARPPWEAPATSSVVQWPDSVSQPSKGLEKSNPSPNAADHATWSAADRPRPKAVLPATSWRLDMSLTIYFLLPMERRRRDAVMVGDDKRNPARRGRHGSV